ncbi:hypothetical protein F2Q69_00045978 [Brassica cretica]|uniref:Uncharacterized protein n=1 Tax=Brassica cretica TaxID=69181 RepID=A0A8S9PWK7_BRACR|nr:hypothetical protein F2Q69_00045978 [Brassica cretica]
MKYPVVVSKESDEISVYPMYLSVVRISGVTADPSPAEPVRQDEVVVSKESDEISVYPMYLSVVRISGVTADPSPAEPVRQDEGSA